MDNYPPEQLRTAVLRFWDSPSSTPAKSFFNWNSPLEVLPRWGCSCRRCQRGDAELTGRGSDALTELARSQGATIVSQLEGLLSAPDEATEIRSLL